MLKELSRDVVSPGKTGPPQKNDAEKMTVSTLCIDPMDRREIVALVWVATGDGVNLKTKLEL